MLVASSASIKDRAFNFVHGNRQRKVELSLLSERIPACTPICIIIPILRALLPQSTGLVIV
jgi:hypothetical protein